MYVGSVDLCVFKGEDWHVLQPFIMVETWILHTILNVIQSYLTNKAWRETLVWQWWICLLTTVIITIFNCNWIWISKIDLDDIGGMSCLSFVRTSIIIVILLSLLEKPLMLWPLGYNSEFIRTMSRRWLWSVSCCVFSQAFLISL